MNISNEKEWVKYSYDTNMNSFYNLFPFLDEDMFGRLKKIFSLLNLNNILVDNVMLLNKTSRQYKINRFLSMNDDNFSFKYAKIEMTSFDTKYKIEFYKSKKGIFTKLITLTKNDVIIKDEILDDYRAQVKLLKNKIERHGLTKDKIKTYLSEEILKLKNDISDELEEYILNYFDIVDMKFYDINTELSWRNNFIVNLFLKKKSKIMKMSFNFHKERRNANCYESFTVYKINSDYKRFDNYNDAYLEFISS